jgi:tRNA(Ile)-lysidine synthase
LGEGGLTVRTWSDGDRIAPLGLDGSKSLSDLFAERRIPRSLRRRLPVISDPEGRVVWVVGVAVSREFAADPDDPTPALITAAVAPSGAGPGA